MAKNNGKVPGTYVSEKELNELGQLLAGFRDYILSHEARLELIEGYINEHFKATSGIDAESVIQEARDERIDAVIGEPTDDSEER